MIVAATKWNPWLVAFSASLGGALGELSGYYAGYIGKRIASIQDMKGYNVISDWINRNGIWTIFIFAALWGGKFIKNVLICFFSTGLLGLLPFWPS